LTFPRWKTPALRDGNVAMDERNDMIDLTLPGMTCGGCARGAIAAIKSLDPAAEVDIDVGVRRVRVTTTASVEAVTAAVQKAGYVPA
jgi:copper chaperone